VNRPKTEYQEVGTRSVFEIVIQSNSPFYFSNLFYYNIFKNHNIDPTLHICIVFVTMKTDRLASGRVQLNRMKLMPGANPTIVSYNEGSVKIYNATSILASF
jgi:hypothetical protein